jgi:predicted house-cleaning noncanonical NTP pyrophosphatase (MazG superfamily)
VRQKLVRDLVPETFDIPSARVRRATEQELGRFLAAKLVEEAEECRASILQRGGPDPDDDVVEELADVLEVVRAIARTRGTDLRAIERVRVAKARERGGFEKRLIWSIPDEVTDAPWVSPSSEAATRGVEGLGP